MYVCIHVNTAFSHICCKEGPEKERKKQKNVQVRQQAILLSWYLLCDASFTSSVSSSRSRYTKLSDYSFFPPPPFPLLLSSHCLRSFTSSIIIIIITTL